MVLFFKKKGAEASFLCRGERLVKVNAILAASLSINYSTITIRPHESLNGKTPSEACEIKVEGENKWKTLIENASKSKKAQFLFLQLLNFSPYMV
jgi:hypothetical protein